MHGKSVYIIFSFLILSFMFNTNVLYKDVQAYPIEQVPCIRSGSQCIYWDHYDLKYYIINSDGKPEYEQLTRDAFNLWENKLNGTFTFTEWNSRYTVVQENNTKEINPTDIVIYISQKSNGNCSDTAAACTMIWVDNGKISRIQVFIFQKSCIQYPPQRFTMCFKTPDRMIWVAIQHELGHALGLDHVKDDLNKPISIMYYKTTDGMVITQEDISAIKRHAQTYR